jgi:inhibitor of cysteine peptidase
VRVVVNDARWTSCIALVSLIVMHTGTALAAESDGPPLTLTTQDNGREVSVGVGNTVVLRLEAIPGTGYGWQVVRNGAPQLQQEGAPVFEPKNRMGEGGAEDEVFQFRVQRSGTTDLELQYRRPSDTRSTAIKTFKIRITSE